MAVQIPRDLYSEVAAHGALRSDTAGIRSGVSALGRDTEKIRRYAKEQEAKDQRLDQLELPTLMKDEQRSFARKRNTKSAALSGSHFQASGFAGGF